VAANLFTDFMSFNICRCSDSVTIKKKMIYASTNETLKKAFTGVKHLECHDEDDFSFDSIVAKLKQSDRA